MGARACEPDPENHVHYFMRPAEEKALVRKDPREP
ncbi:hypothetical protein DNTS_013283, partial [Danionella cerebrum]